MILKPLNTLFTSIAMVAVVLVVLYSCNEAIHYPYSITLNLDRRDAQKTITVHSNIYFEEVQTLNMLCTGIEPLCGELCNEGLSLRICHKTIRERDREGYKLLGSKERMSQEIKGRLEERLEEESQRYSRGLQIDVLNLKVYASAAFEQYSYSFFMTHPSNRELIHFYEIMTDREYLTLEFWAEGHELTPDDMSKEIHYILNHIYGLPAEL